MNLSKLGVFFLACLLYHSKIFASEQDLRTLKPNNFVTLLRAVKEVEKNIDVTLDKGEHKNGVDDTVFFLHNLDQPAKKRKVEQKKVTFSEIVTTHFFEKDLEDNRYVTVFWDHVVDEILFRKNKIYKAKKVNDVYFSFNENSLKYPFAKFNQYCSNNLEKRSHECSLIKKVIEIKKTTLLDGKKITLLRVVVNKYAL